MYDHQFCDSIYITFSFRLKNMHIEIKLMLYDEFAYFCITIGRKE